MFKDPCAVGQRVKILVTDSHYKQHTLKFLGTHWKRTFECLYFGVKEKNEKQKVKKSQSIRRHEKRKNWKFRGNRKYKIKW